MEVHLTSSQNFEFGNGELATTTVTKICSPASDKKYCQRYMELLRDALHEKFSGKRRRLNEDINWPVKLKFVAQPDVPNIVTGWILSANERNEKCLIHRLSTILGDTSKFKMGFSLKVTSNTPGSTPFEMEAKPCNTNCFRINVTGIKVYGFDSKIEMKSLYEAVTSGQTLQGDQLTVKLQLQEEALEILRLDSVKDPLSINKKLLSDTNSMDTVIICGNGGTVKCHRVFLTAHSPVFQAMFESSMIEGATGTLKLVDMTEPGVRALVKYLYTWELTEATMDSTISTDLLIVAEKYGIKRLEVDARELIVSKRKEWFTVSSTLQLLQFARAKMTSGKEHEYKLLESKAVQVLKSMSAGELNDCKEYQDLFSNPMAGMEFCSYMITKKKSCQHTDSGNHE